MSRENNFDLIRLFAALQVLIIHVFNILSIENKTLSFLIEYCIRFFPGVPIFFVLSGFLIYSSYERNKYNLFQFYLNRALRIFPALWACLIITISLLVYYFPDKESHLITSYDFIKWIAAQLSFFQFYTPEIIKFFGTGNPNGSLWTITIEIQFYLLMPFIFKVVTKFKKGLIILILFSILSSVLFRDIHHENSFIGKISTVIVLPYLWYFLTGIFIKRSWSIVKIYIVDKFWFWFVLYYLFALFSTFGLGVDLGNYWVTNIYKPLSTLLLSCTVFSFSFSFNGLSKKIINGNDFSYGIYIYHFLIANYMLHNGFVNELTYWVFVLFLTVILGIISWYVIEKPSLRLKNSITRYKKH